MEDTEIIDLYWQRDQRAIDETHGKYGGFLAGIAWNIPPQSQRRGGVRQRHVSAHLERHSSGPPLRLPGLAGAHRPQPSLDRWKQSRTAKRGGDGMEVLLGELDDCVPEPHGTEKTMEDQEIASLISAFLRRQSPESRIIFLRRYWYGQSVADIAAGMNCGEGKVKSSLFRTRKALRTYLEQEEVFL